MQFPLELRFKLLALSSQLTVTDAQGTPVFYVKQKAFKLKEAVTVYADEGQTRALYTINADRILDVSARYRISDIGGAEIGVVQRMGLRSFWKAHYEVHRGGQRAFLIREENAWVKVLDGIVGSIPIISLFAGYMFNPSYLVSRGEGAAPLLRLIKRPALLEGYFRIEMLQTSRAIEGLDLAVLSILMMVLLERARG